MGLCIFRAKLRIKWPRSSRGVHIYVNNVSKSVFIYKATPKSCVAGFEFSCPLLLLGPCQSWDLRVASEAVAACEAEGRLRFLGCFRKCGLGQIGGSHKN